LDFKKHKAFSKLHVVCGTHTHIITEVKVTESKASEQLFLKELIGKTAERFRMKRVCADAGYLSRENVQAIADVGARPFIMPRKNVRRLSLGYPAWNKMIHMFEDNLPRVNAIIGTGTVWESIHLPPVERMIGRPVTLPTGESAKGKIERIKN
jgi:hypothetical protein